MQSRPMKIVCATCILAWPGLRLRPLLFLPINSLNCYQGVALSLSEISGGESLRLAPSKATSSFLLLS